MGSFPETYDDLRFFNLFNTYTAKAYTLTGSYSCWESVINSYRVLVGQKPMVYYKSKLIEYGFQGHEAHKLLNCKQRFWKRSKTELSSNLLAEPLSPLKNISFHILLVSAFAAALLKRSSAKLQESSFLKIYISWRCEIAKKIICWQATHILYNPDASSSKVVIKWYNNVPAIPSPNNMIDSFQFWLTRP